MGAQMYNVFGKQVGSHYLAIGTLVTLFGGAFISTRGGSKAPPASPPIVAASSDEADFIKKFLEEQDKAAPASAKH